MSSLAAFAILRGNEVFVLESLDDHLRNVAKYVSMLMHRDRFRALGVTAALLHDVGKGLELYQKCVVNRRDGSCSYVGHEILSALMVWRGAIEVDVGSLKLPIDGALAKCLLTIAILWHHQAMGDPRERFAELATRLKGRSTRYARIDEGVLNVLINVSKDLGIGVRVNYEALRELNNDLEEISTKGSDLYNELGEALRELVRRGTKYILLAKYLTGFVILADTFQAMSVRGGNRDRIRYAYLSKMVEFVHEKVCKQ